MNLTRRRILGLAATLLMVPGCTWSADNDASAPQLEHVSTYVWRDKVKDFGGFSGIEIGDDGNSFMALSDRATVRWGSIARGADGRIRDMNIEGQARLKDSEGKPLIPGLKGDSEGIAQGPGQSFWVSFEGIVRVAYYETPESTAQLLPKPPEFKRMQRNSALEALAVTPDGTLLTMPERSGALDRPFPIWRYRDGNWDQPFEMARSGNWLPVAADVGPDGKLYILERDFKGLLGFLNRLRRFDLTETGLTNEQVLLQSRPLQYDNLEGMAVWHDGSGIRVTMISDDNFNFLQRTEIVEYRIRD